MRRESVKPFSNHPSTSDRDLNPVTGIPVYCETDSLDHSTTKVGPPEPPAGHPSSLCFGMWSSPPYGYSVEMRSTGVEGGGGQDGPSQPPYS
uniref:Uncharacterized protein n=1 Tax=Timema shepardi TaxID=629360 RepID=A0A7R9G0H8_TIMSH|nr:unnamed protein product [Timema shepardi]